MPNDSHRPDVAVFIDFENVYVSVRDKLDANPNFEMIMDRVEDFGRVVIARAYADWYRYPRVTSALYANGIEPMYVPTYYYDRDLGRTGRAIKNSVDMNLCIDAMKTLFTNPNIARFVLATGDRDFIPLVNSIRQQGKEVIIIGIGGAASSHLAQSADEFIFYEQLIGKKPQDLHQDQPRARMPEKGREYDTNPNDNDFPRAREREAMRTESARFDSPARTESARIEQPARVEQPTRAETPRAEPVRQEPVRQEPARQETPAQPDIYDTLVSAINLARERGYVCSFGSLKLLMKELMGGDFREGKYKDTSGRPFAKFKDFVLEAERRGKVQVFTSGTVNEVFLPGEDPLKLSQFAGDIKEEEGAPIIQISEPELRPEPRESVAGNNRRRRRRSRGGQRPNGPPQDGIMQLDEGDDEQDNDEIEYTAPAESARMNLYDPYAHSSTAVSQAAQDEQDARSEAVFEELLERVEEEAAETESIAELAPIEILSEPTAPDDPNIGGDLPSTLQDSYDREAANTATAAFVSQPFTETEWNHLREVMSQFDRPASFVQIHNVLRDSRNNAGITRTNEELRSLIKQSINSGVLERIGKGNRISYRLAALAEGDNQGQPSRSESDNPLINDQTALDQTAQIAPPADDRATPAQSDASADVPEFHTPEAAAQAVQLTDVTPEPQPKRSRRKPAEKAAAAPPPAAEAKPARTSRRKPAAAAETPVPTDTEAPAKPKRPRRKKADATE